MIDNAGNPRLAFTAAKVVTRETRGFQPVKTYRTGSTWMLKMVDASGRIKVAAWSTSGAYAAPWPAELRGVFSTGVDIFGRLTTTDGQTCWVTETPVIWGGSPEPAAKRRRR